MTGLDKNNVLIKYRDVHNVVSYHGKILTEISNGFIGWIFLLR